MKRRNFLKGICALAAAPLAAALPVLQPHADSVTGSDDLNLSLSGTYITEGVSTEHLSMSTIRRIEEQLSGYNAKPWDSDRCLLVLDWSKHRMFNEVTG